MNHPLLALPAGYADWLTSLKQRIQGARQRALLSANAEQIRLYHDIGRDILVRQSQQGWGARIIERLSADLRAAFPGMKGFSVRNLLYMRQFAEQCPHGLFVQQSAAQIGQQSADQLPWFHIVTLLTKLSDVTLRDWSSGCCSAEPKTVSSPNTPSPVSTNQSAWPNTNSSAPCPSRSIPASPASRPSKPNSGAICSPTLPHPPPSLRWPPSHEKRQGKGSLPRPEGPGQCRRRRKGDLQDQAREDQEGRAPAGRARSRTPILSNPEPAPN